MEELRSTEILDREIQDDARKKADKILKFGDSECERVRGEVAQRVERLRAEKRAEYAARLDAFKRDVASSIPLEKQRRRIAFVDSAVREALDSWLSGLGAEGRMRLFAALLAGYREPLAGKRLAVVSSGYSAEAARAVVDAAFGKAAVASVTELSAAEALQKGFSDGLVVESEDGSVVCRATAAEIRSALLNGKREELAEALLGGRLPE
jgi:V/A-type H+-transporting ATPase subunit E